MTPSRLLSGCVFWITGYSGSGKTTVAQALYRRYREEGRANALLLDGDVLRSIFGRGLGYAAAERHELARSYGRLCAELAGQGACVICATISMFDDVRQWNRANIPRYREIYLRVPVEERRRRDPKGLYEAALARADSPMAGLDQSYEEPKTPDLVIDNFGTRTASHAVELIWNTFVEPSLR